MPQSPDLADVILAALGVHQEGVYTALPGRVVSYDRARQCAHVRPGVATAYLNEAGDRVTEAMTIIPNVPVMFPRAGGFRITFPVRAGDSVLLVMTSCAMERWLIVTVDTDPEDDRRNTINDAVAIIGLSDFASALSEPPDDAMTIGMEEGPQIEIDGLHIDAGGDEPLATVAELNALITKYNAHVHTAAGSPTTIPTAVASSAAGTQILRGG